MYLEKSNIEKLADVSRISLTEEEKDSITKKVNELLSHLKKLDELDTDNIVPTEKIASKKGIFRKDEVIESLDLNDVFKNAPDEYKHFFRVPKIIED